MGRPGLTGHRKFRRLVRTLGSALIARGALELLWEPSYESGEDYVGTSDDIEHLVGWTGERGLLTRALADAGAPEGYGFIEAVMPSDDMRTQGEAETRYRIHDLWHHAPDYVRKRRDREMERRQKVEPNATDRRTAPNGGQRTATQEWQIGVDRPPAPSPAPAPSPSPHSVSRVSPADIVRLWNELTTAPIPKVEKLTSDRKSKIDARLKTFPDVATWRTVITWLNSQNWCRAPGTGEHPNWTATLDWLCKTDGVIQRWLEKAKAEKTRAPAKTSTPSNYLEDVGYCFHTPRCTDSDVCRSKRAAEKVKAS